MLPRSQVPLSSSVRRKRDHPGNEMSQLTQALTFNQCCQNCKYPSPAKKKEKKTGYIVFWVPMDKQWKDTTLPRVSLFNFTTKFISCYLRDGLCSNRDTLIIGLKCLQHWKSGLWFEFTTVKPSLQNGYDKPLLGFTIGYPR